MKAVVATFNQEKALVGAFSVIVQLHRLIIYSTNAHIYLRTQAPGLVGGDDHVGGDEECSVLSWRNNIVSLVPHPLVHPLDK